MRSLGVYMDFWRRAFSLEENLLDLKGLHITFQGSYLERDEDLIYLFQTSNITVLAISPRNWQKYFPNIRPPEAGGDERIWEPALASLPTVFDDIDHDLPTSALKTWKASSPHVRFLNGNDREALDELYRDCDEDDRDTTEPDLGSDLVCGLFEGGDLISMASGYQIRETQILDLTVVTKRSARGRGCAVAVLQPLIRAALKEGFFPRYRARRQNLATLKTAQRLGFLPHGSLRVFQAHIK